MKVLFIHNYYQHPGGEDVVFQQERQLLERNDHRIVEYLRHSEVIARYGLWRKATLVVRTTWAWDSYREIRALLESQRPDVAHFHNTFPLVSPAAYYACRDTGVPVVQSVHNPRLLCPTATLFRDGRVCEECVDRSLFRAVNHGCYRASRAASATVALMLAVHRWLGTWTHLVNCYIVFTEFYRRKLAQAGLPEEKIVVKPHFVEDHGIQRSAGSYGLFVGRLTPEKGVDTLLEAWRKLGHIPLKVRGEGPLTPKVQRFAEQFGSAIQLLPRLPEDGLVGLMQGARFLVWPSEGYYETFGLVAAEALSCGVPVIASRIGVMEEIVDDQRTGLHFTPGDAEDLAAKVEWAWTHPKEMETMGRAARAEYEAKYTAKRNYELLMEIYGKVLGARG